MSTTDTGKRAEAAAAAFLEQKGCSIIMRNWRTRMCEIDIVAKRGDTVYFCEVKYRRTRNQGSGLDYVTPKKLQQMRFAAESWVHKHGYTGLYQLAAVEVAGTDFRVTAAVNDLG